MDTLDEGMIIYFGVVLALIVIFYPTAWRKEVRKEDKWTRAAKKWKEQKPSP